jgi:hypothetical protein
VYGNLIEVVPVGNVSKDAMTGTGLSEYVYFGIASFTAGHVNYPSWEPATFELRRLGVNSD